MSRKVHRVPVMLDSKDIVDIPMEDIKLILRGADAIIMTSGRSMLVKILKGSKDKKIIEYHLNECPAYGYYHNITMNEISARVDWMIKHDYLRIQYNHELPILIFAERGWEIEKETFTQELYQLFCKALELNNYQVLSRMKTFNRQVVLDLLDRIEAYATIEWIPLLDNWKKIEVKKICSRIDSVENTIRQREK